MSNLVENEFELTTLQKYAVMGFLFGADNLGETVVTVTEKPIFHKVGGYYSLTVILREPNDQINTSTASINFYVGRDKKVMKIYSSKPVMDVILTDELLKELRSADVVGI